MSSIKKPKHVTAPETAMQAVPDPAPATAVQAKDPVDDYLDRNYPGLSRSLDIPGLLQALVRETVKTRFENGRN